MLCMPVSEPPAKKKEKFLLSKGKKNWIGSQASYTAVSDCDVTDRFLTNNTWET